MLYITSQIYLQFEWRKNIYIHTEVLEKNENKK